VFLAILILVVLTFGALAVAHWYKRRSASGRMGRPFDELAKIQNRVARISSSGVVVFVRLEGDQELFLE
jgi:hypothetical protein